jgi:hypothetical protein
VPTRSSHRPLAVCPIEYATRKAMTTHAKSEFVHRNSVFSTGASTLSV